MKSIMLLSAIGASAVDTEADSYAMLQTKRMMDRRADALAQPQWFINKGKDVPLNDAVSGKKEGKEPPPQPCDANNHIVGAPDPQASCDVVTNDAKRLQITVKTADVAWAGTDCDMMLKVGDEEVHLHTTPLHEHSKDDGDLYERDSEHTHVVVLGDTPSNSVVQVGLGACSGWAPEWKVDWIRLGCGEQHSFSDHDWLKENQMLPAFSSTTVQGKLDLRSERCSAYEPPSTPEVPYEQPAYEPPSTPETPYEQPPAYVPPVEETPYEQPPSTPEVPYEEPPATPPAYEPPSTPEVPYEQPPSTPEVPYEQPPVTPPAYDVPSSEEPYEQPPASPPYVAPVNPSIPAYQTPEEVPYEQPSTPAYDEQPSTPAYEAPAPEEPAYSAPEEPAYGGRGGRGHRHGRGGRTPQATYD